MSLRIPYFAEPNAKSATTRVSREQQMAAADATVVIVVVLFDSDKPRHGGSMFGRIAAIRRDESCVGAHTTSANRSMIGCVVVGNCLRPREPIHGHTERTTMGYSDRRCWVAAAALLLHCWWVPSGVGSSIVGPRNRDVFKNLELLEFVVRNDQAWRFVLKQQIRVNDREDRLPVYHYAYYNAPDSEVWHSLYLIDDGAAVTSPMPVIKRVLHHHRWFGSHIEYAVRVLNTAFVCTTYGFLQVQIELIVLLMTKKKKAATDDIAAVDDRPVAKGIELVVQFVDMLAAVHGSLLFLSDLANEYVRITLERPDNELAALQIMAQRVRVALDAECVAIKRDTVILEFSDAKMKFDYLNEETVTDCEINTVLNSVTAGMVDTFDRLNVETMPPSSWIQILDFGTAVRRHIDAIVVVDENGRPIPESKEATSKAKTGATAVKKANKTTAKKAVAKEATEAEAKEVAEVAAKKREDAIMSDSLSFIK